MKFGKKACPLKIWPAQVAKFFGRIILNILGKMQNLGERTKL